EGLTRERFDAMVEDLQAAGSAALVVAGESQPPVVHALAAAINQTLGGVGTTVTYIDSVSARPAVHMQDLTELTAALRSGDVDALVVIGANPAYTAPADLEFAAALSQAAFSAHLGLHRDETGSLCDWHVPKTHFLETWSDARAYDGTTTITQPLILPFYGGKSEHELLAAMLGDTDASGYD